MKYKACNKPEKKYITHAWTAAQPTNANPDLSWLTGIAQGDSNGERIGKRVTLRSLYMNADIKQNNSATMTSVRVLMIISNLSEGEKPSLAKVLVKPDDYRSPLNVDYAGREFKVIADKYWDLSINGTRIKRFKKFFKFKRCGLDIQYVKNDGNQDDDTMIGANNIFIWWLTNEADAAKPEINMTTRICYTDS